MELDQRLERELVSLVALTRLRRCLSIRSSSNWTLTVWFYFPAVIALLLLFLAGATLPGRRPLPQENLPR